MSKRQNHEIKDAILDALKRYPMNSSQISKKIGSSQSTVKKFLEELQDLSIVREIKVRIRGKEKQVWELVK